MHKNIGKEKHPNRNPFFSQQKTKSLQIKRYIPSITKLSHLSINILCFLHYFQLESALFSIWLYNATPLEHP